MDCHKKNAKASRSLTMSITSVKRLASNTRKSLFTLTFVTFTTAYMLYFLSQYTFFLDVFLSHETPSLATILSQTYESDYFIEQSKSKSAQNRLSFTSPLNPLHLGLTPFCRHDQRSFFINSDLWDAELFAADPNNCEANTHDAEKHEVGRSSRPDTKSTSRTSQTNAFHALPTNAWWQPWVISSGDGKSSLINQLPYILAIRIDPAYDIASYERFGLDVQMPFPTFLQTADNLDGQRSSMVGISQMENDQQSGFFVGAMTMSAQESLTKHYVSGYGPLKIIKTWDVRVYERSNITGEPDLSNMIKVSLNATIIRGASFIDFSYPPHVIFTAMSLQLSVSKPAKNRISQIIAFSRKSPSLTTDCLSLSQTFISSDAFEISLEGDSTRWLFVFDDEIKITCVSENLQDVIRSLGPLSQPLKVRVALTDMSQHPAIAKGDIIGGSSIVPSLTALSESDMRWRMISKLKSKDWSVLQFVAHVNKQVEKAPIFENEFVNFPLRKYLTNIQQSYGFELELVEWGSQQFLDSIQNSSLLILPGDLDSWGDKLWFSDYIIPNVQDAVSNKNLSVLVLGGARSGIAPALLGGLFGLEIVYADVIRSIDRIVKLESIMTTLPPFTSPDFYNHLTPQSMPEQIPVVTGSLIVIESIMPFSNLAQFNAYCEPQVFGIDIYSCKSSVMAQWYWGSNVIQWLGVDFSVENPAFAQEWLLLLERAIAAAGCTVSHTAGNTLPCVKPSKVTLVYPKKSLEQEKAAKQLYRKLAGINEGESITDQTKEIDLTETLLYLKGAFQNTVIDHQNHPLRRISANPSSAVLRDIILRHALLIPFDAHLSASVGDLQTALFYELEAKFLNEYKKHSLFPPTASGSDTILWDPAYALLYMLPLHIASEYQEYVNQTFKEKYFPSENFDIEGSSTACLPTIAGLVCARSFGILPSCKLNQPPFEDYDKFFIEADRRRVCTPEDLEIYMLEKTKALQSKKVKLGLTTKERPTFLLFDLPDVDFDVKTKINTGEYISLSQELDTTWQAALSWAITQDLGNVHSVDPFKWVEKSAADDLGEWAIAMFQHAQIAVIASLLSVQKEKKYILRALKASLIAFFKNQYDNKALLYDATWGGIVPCGCDRASGRGLCFPPSRQKNQDKNDKSQSLSSISNWLSLVCPSLKSQARDAGAGFFHDHHVLWGYIVYAVAVTIHLDPSFASHKVRMTTAKGIFQPSINQLTIALIQDYANPFNFKNGLYESKSSEGLDLLHLYFPQSRYKDWWKLHSYGQSLSTQGQPNIRQYSVSEATFGYWAVSLYAVTSGDHELAQWGRLLTALEIISGNFYWHIYDGSTWLPDSLKSLKAFGEVSELYNKFSSISGSAEQNVYASLATPPTYITYTLLNPSWAIDMFNKWKKNSKTPPSDDTFESRALDLLLFEAFTKDWIEELGTDLLDPQKKSRTSQTCINHFVDKLLTSECISMGNPRCGINTLTTSIFWAALASMMGGAPAIIQRMDGIDKFRVA